MRAGLPRRLLVELGLSVSLAFALTLGITFALVSKVADGNALALMRRQLVDIRGQIEERINQRLLMTAMQVRDRLDGLPDQSCASYRQLAREMLVDEICRADSRGVCVGSTRKSLVGLDFRKIGAFAAEFTCLLDREIEFCQPVRPSEPDGEDTKYAGVWLPAGGFVQIGCQLSAVERLTMTALTGLTHDIHVAGCGNVVITTERGQIISAARESGREGSMFEPPDEKVYYHLSDSVTGFPVHVIVPRKSMTIVRDVFTGLTAVLVLVALIFVAVLVAVMIARYVREQIARRTAADMAMAASIQASSLPRIFPPYPALVGNFDIYAVMRPAKDVGGDFYDFYHAGADRLALVVADVSGKGVPAAMFMMKAKTMLKTRFSSGGDLATIVGAVNDALSEGNDDNLFVTAWIGVVDLKTGAVSYVNAGHNPPLVKAADGAIRMLEESPDLPLAAFGGYSYVSHETVLHPGETLLLYTDGVTEAKNRTAQLFGDDRLRASFAKAPAAASAACQAIVADVAAFAGEAPQADDMTLLVYGFVAPVGQTRKRTFPPSVGAIASCGRMVDEAGFGPDAHVVVDEIVSNIVRCSGATTFEFEITPSRELIFRDNGSPFDPTAQASPDVTLSAEDRAIGGLGLFLVRELAKDVAYRREGGWNVLTVRL